MTTQTANTITARARFFAGAGLETLRVRIEDDAALPLRSRVQPYDEVAGHYTVCHSLTDAACRRIIRMARTAQ